MQHIKQKNIWGKEKGNHQATREISAKQQQKRSKKDRSNKAISEREKSNTRKETKIFKENIAALDTR